MKIKFVIIALLHLIIAENGYTQMKKDSVFITGTLLNFNNEIRIDDMSEMKDLELPDSKRKLLPDSSGNFSIKFNLNKPNYFRLGRNILYLSPGDSMSVFINYMWPDSSIFKGKHSEENEYLRFTPFPKAGSFLEAGDNIKSTIQQTIDTILIIAKNRQELLNNNIKISSGFKVLENARIKADILNSLRNIRSYFPYIHKLTGDSLIAFQAENKKIIDKYLNHYSNDFINPVFLKLLVYRSVLPIILDYAKDSSENMRKIKDWIKAAELVQQLNELNSKKEIATYEKKINKIQSAEYRQRVTSTFKNLMKFGSGDKAKDFIITNSASESYHLKKFTGKVVYIDVWATWCGPCMAEFPFLDSLKEKYKNNENIVFISLSIDDNKALWKKNIEKRNAQGIQGIIDRSKLEEYAIVTIPKVIIINKDFKLVTMNGPWPSDRSAVKLLDDLLK